MSNLHNLHGVVIEMTSYLHHLTQNQTQKHGQNGEKGYKPKTHDE